MLETIARVLNVNSATEAVWVSIGLFGQLMFTARFLVQWLVSERERKSVIPIAFWYFSLSGGIILLTYAIYRADPVFILGQSMGLTIYLRNLFLIRRERREARLGQAASET